jgi:hypothetical protein
VVEEIVPIEVEVASAEIDVQYIERRTAVPNQPSKRAIDKWFDPLINRWDK